MSPSPTRFLIIRHGETEWNVQRREMGQLDSPLTALGIAQARAVATRIATAHSPVAIHASDLGRAAHTARIIGEACQVEPLSDPRLRERHYGLFQGRTFDEAEAFRPGARAAFRTADADYVVPDDGESARQAGSRALASLEAIATAHTGGTVVVVTHGSLLMLIVEQALGLPYGAGKRFKHPNAALNILVRTSSHWNVETWGDVTHLSGISLS